MGFYEYFKFFVVLFVFLTGVSAFSSQAPVVELVDGEKMFVIHDVNGTKRVGSSGEQLKYGDVLKTSSYTTVKVLYPDGSKVLVGKGTQYRIEKEQKEIQVGSLLDGKVRALIKHKMEKRKNLPNFIFRGKNCTLGVRGTDFVAGTASEGSDVHTLKGVVDVAPTEAELIDGFGTPVGEGEMVAAGKEGVGEVKKFNKEEYLKQLQKEQPSFASMVRNDKSAWQIAYNQDASNKLIRPSFRPLSFHAAWMMFKMAKDESMLFRPTFVWAPEFDVSSKFVIRGNLAFSPIEPAKNSVLMEMSMHVTYSILSRLFTEAGGGVGSIFGGQTGMSILAGANVGWRFSYTSYLERIFLGPTLMKINDPYPMNALMIRLGVGFQL